MPKYIIKDAVLVVNSVDLSSRVASVSVIMEGDDVDVSTMGTGVHEHLTGLRNDRFEVTFLSDFDADMVDDTLFPLLADADSQPEFAVYAQPFSGAISTTNPRYSTDRAILNTYQPIAGAVGARSEVTVTFFSNEAIDRALS